jgi:hypothetical protein
MIDVMVMISTIHYVMLVGGYLHREGLRLRREFHGAGSAPVEHMYL